jgi:hypothetical protein
MNFSGNPEAGTNEDRNEPKLILGLAVVGVAIIGAASGVRADIFNADVTVGPNASAAFTCTTMHLEDLTTVEGLAFDYLKHDFPGEKVVYDKITGHMYLMRRQDISFVCPKITVEDEILVIELR